jgi:hypothetical protein
MSFYKMSPFAILTLSIVVSCGAANFSGTSRTGPYSPPKAPATTPTPGGIAPGKTSTPGGIAPGKTPTPGGIAPGSTGSSTPQIGPNNQVNQPNANTIVFGVDKVFHVGDGKFQNTSCMQQVSALPLAGNAYFFEFEVLTDSTELTVVVAKLCGIDYSSNTYEVYASNSRLQTQAIPAAAHGLTSPVISLNKGVYTVILGSGYGIGAGQMASDLDDYVVGNVTMSGSKPVRPVRYGAYNR